MPDLRDGISPTTLDLPATVRTGAGRRLLDGVPVRLREPYRRPRESKNEQEILAMADEQDVVAATNLVMSTLERLIDDGFSVALCPYHATSSFLSPRLDD
jgi:hypothetical protein